MRLSKLLALVPLLPLALAAPSPAGHPDSAPGKANSHAGDLAKRAPAGFVTPSGTGFSVDGRPFCFAGMNAYWMAQFVTEAQVSAAFARMQEIGVKVLRTWAFSMVESVPGYDLTYYQTWNGNSYTLNTGANGLRRLDWVVKYAEQYGIKLILAFTNNWNDYGGMDMYLSHITGNNTYHSDFYTDPRVIAAYESYVSAIVTRYASSAGIFAWELTNEARSGGYPSVARPGFSADDLTAWVAARSRFVKALDPHHMVAVGDEGYYNWANSTDYIYDGASGGDFEATLRLPSVDFGTLHLYPEAWSKTPTLGWGVEYIAQHAASMREIGKPVVFEEFNIDGYAQQQAVLPKWIDVAVAAGIPGIMPWGLGAQGLDISGSSVWTGGGIDSMDIYPDKTALWAVLKKLGETMNAKCPSGGGTSTLPPSSSTKVPASTSSASTSSASTSSASTSSAPAASSSVAACTPVPQWGQCDGRQHTGCKACAAPYTCQFMNEWYSQCK